MVVVALLDYRQLRLYAPVVYVASCLGLLVVLTPLGSIVNGAHSWISLPGGFQIEPSEYAKLSVILISAILLGELRARRDSGPGCGAVAIALAVAAVPIVLVVAEPDLGVVMLMLALVIGADRAVRRPAALARLGTGRRGAGPWSRWSTCTCSRRTRSAG